MQNTGTKQIFFLVTVLATVTLGLVWPVLHSQGEQAAVELMAQEATDLSICQSVSSGAGEVEQGASGEPGSELCAPGQRFKACCRVATRRWP